MTSEKDCRRRQKHRGDTSNRTESRRRKLEKECCGHISPELVDKFRMITLPVGPYVLIQIIRNCSGHVKGKLHTQHNLQGTSWIQPRWGEIRCPSCV